MRRTGWLALVLATACGGKLDEGAGPTLDGAANAGRATPPCTTPHTVPPGGVPCNDDGCARTTNRSDVYWLCTPRCDVDADCPVGFTCEQGIVCMPTCNETADCPAPMQCRRRRTRDPVGECY